MIRRSLIKAQKTHLNLVTRKNQRKGYQPGYNCYMMLTLPQNS